MAQYNYSYKVSENMAKAVGRHLPISYKYSVEICRYLRGKPMERAKAILTNVINMKEPIPFKRYVKNIGHRPKMGPGRYPIKASKYILALLDSVTANAQMKGLATGKLEICHISAQRGPMIMHRGRTGRTKMKQTHIEVVVRESKEEKKKAAEQKTKAVKAGQENKPKAAEKKVVEKKVDAKKAEPKPEEKKAEETPKVEAK